MRVTSVLLAAGQGTRMKSGLPKVLHPICGQPMIEYALRAAWEATTELPVVVIGHGAEAVRQFLGEAAECVVQEPQLGTAHAVQQAEPLLRGATDLVLVTYADMPLLRPETLKRLVETQRQNSGPITLLTVFSANPRGFGRILRDEQGRISGIVEEAVASPEQLAIRELNVGAYCFRADWLWDALPRIPISPKGEYYLTDTVALAVADGFSVASMVLEDWEETIGVNTRIHLAEAEAAMRRRINNEHMLAGVTLIDPATTYIEPGVVIGQDTVIWPNTYLRGETVIGRDCIIGPDTMITDSTIGNACMILKSVLEGAVVEDHVDIGPFARLRKGAHLCEGVHMGNFGEVKDSTLGPGVKMGHFSYIGNATIGANVNIGAGTITCNYDGERKNHTEIGDDAFIGSDTMLVAPVKVGARARTGAGAVVTKDVPPDTLVVGVPARPLRKLTPPDAESQS
ncbi:MAG: bifunctional UDP-N-acetylglucosamine diphosphorylase/glucosamine-1-phosphate N-acetyltransferase GlmU [Anaerolineales bacterium]|nr:bifunctional UDP-N-acetylglucosamine diphosphorylase/glucosamine-1-phosphate N-acetyltransferase GlmU [Anaerolineales bacterium]MCX7608184.1 bifunctional UDP-N-acetylglucosamine diphosphorylase/glucosamine-1-phosphate N-acetyltransferase GlmU [Anaerolineales bacterium]MDW8226353.1 bifunctional UDP-N-acetylglucosamine diphosphorylase/glucosamine-1-phosphate N-acetyltransferase GlmU [Anaerolineales bacterium]